MTESEYNLFAVMFVAMLAWIVWKAIRHPVVEEVEEDDSDDFEYLTVREQLATAKKTSDALGDMEQLLTDMQLCSADDILVVHVEWVGRDNECHAYDLFCNGIDTATECMGEIAEREARDLRRTLAYQCAVLAGGTRSRKYCRKYGTETVGEDEIAEAVSAMWDDHINE